MGHISPSSLESGDSILPSTPSDSPASGRSNGTNTAPLFSNDTGPEYRDGEMLLPTPNGQNFNDGESAESIQKRREENKAKGINGNGFGLTTAMALTLLQEGFLANPSAKPEDARAETTTGGFGL